jgi:hypothetical protein
MHTNLTYGTVTQTHRAGKASSPGRDGKMSTARVIIHEHIITATVALRLPAVRHDTWRSVYDN